MFKLKQDFFGVFAAEDIQTLLESIPDETQLVGMLHSVYGNAQLLRCRDVGVYVVDGVPTLRVGEAIVWMNGKVISGKDLTLSPIDSEHRSVVLILDDESAQALTASGDILRVKPYPRLLSVPLGQTPQNGIEIARLQPTAQDGVEIDASWWPNVLRIDHDGRSLAALKAISSRLPQLPHVNNRLAYLVANGERLRWPDLLPSLLDSIEQRQSACQFMPTGMLGDDALCVAWVLRQMNGVITFPAELNQLGRDMKFRFCIEPSNEAENNEIVFERPSEAGPQSWLAIVASSPTGDSDLRITVSGSGSVLVPAQRATLVKEWGQKARIILNASESVRLRAAVYE